MSRLALVAILVPALALPLARAAEAPAAGPEADRAFAAALEACTAAEHRTPHPFVRGFTAEHRIAGEVDGRCDYEQSMPGGMRMTCSFSAEGRKAMAAEFRAQAEGRMSGSTAETKAWQQECTIHTADGKTLPMAGG